MRYPRCVVPDVPHHVVQRGNRREQVFFNELHYAEYLTLLHRHSLEANVLILGYCLMPNHVHHILVPRAENSLALALKPVHQRYAEHRNKEFGWRGHIWQDRFFSCPMDADHYGAALRYVELNPVRAGLVLHPAEYRWSSAAAHIAGVEEPPLRYNDTWREELECIQDWKAWLESGLTDEQIVAIRRRTFQNKPWGNQSFIRSLERELKLGYGALEYRAPGEQLSRPVDK